MAKYNEILTGRHNKFVAKLFGMKGLAPTPQLSGDIQMTHPIFHGSENRVLESWHKFGLVRGLIAQAGGPSALRLNNPIGSNIVAVIERWYCGGLLANGAIMTTQFNTNVTLTTFVIQPNSFDARGQTASNLIFSDSNGGNLAALPDSKAEVFFPANSGGDFVITHDDEIPLLPGTAIEVQTSVVNQAATQFVFWRERFLEDSERSL